MANPKLKSCLHLGPAGLTAWILASLAAHSAGQATSIASVDSTGLLGNGASYGPSISADGRYVAFYSSSSNLVAGDLNNKLDVFVRDTLAETTELVSIDSNAVQGAGDSSSASFSGDGRFVAFSSSASNLVAGDTNGQDDVFLRDRLLHRTTLVSVGFGGVPANLWSLAPRITPDGRFIAYVSGASNLVPGSGNGFIHVYVCDLSSSTTERISETSVGVQGDGDCAGCGISADGRYVVFDSWATNLVTGDTNGWADVFVHDRLLGTLQRVSVDSAGAQGNQKSQYPSISGDGHVVAFRSQATNLVAGDTNGMPDAFIHDLLSGATERVSVSSAGVEGNGVTVAGSISADGRFVSMTSSASNLVVGDTNNGYDILVRDRAAGTTARVSVSSSGAQSTGNSDFSVLSADGRFVAFECEGSNLVAGDTNAVRDVFVHAQPPFPPLPFCFGDGSAGACPCANYGLAGRGCENSASTGGAVLSAAGNSSLAGDTLVLTSSGGLPSSTSVLLQGSSSIAPKLFGDGLRCVGGALKRMYVHAASGGSMSAPQPGDLSISARSTALGDVISAGALRYYQTYYRDSVGTFCTNPPGSGWNVSAGLVVTWEQWPESTIRRLIEGFGAAARESRRFRGTRPQLIRSTRRGCTPAGSERVRTDGPGRLGAASDSEPVQVPRSPLEQVA